MWGIGGAPGFQTEMGGGPQYSDRNSDWWAWTHDPANIAAHRVSGDFPENGPGGWKNGYTADIANAKALGVNTWRMGIEWSRIFPRSTASVKIGRTVSTANLKALDRLADQAAVSKYRTLLTSVRKAGMKPFVVINTYTLPIWIHDPINARDVLAKRKPDDPVPVSLQKGGWLTSSTVSEYRKYSAYLAWKFGSLVDWWAPLNEPMVTAIYGYANIPGAFAGNFPPGAYSYRSSTLALENMAEANAVAYDEVHAKDTVDSDKDGKRSWVGLIHNLIHFTPANPASAGDIAATRHADQVFNRLFPDAAIKGIFDYNGNGVVDPGETDRSKAGKADFFGVNYYFRGRVVNVGFSLSGSIPILDFLPKTGYRWAGNPTGELCPTLCSDFGAEIDPDGLGAVLREAAGYGKPLIVTENGIADTSDSKRPSFLVNHVHQVAKTAKEKPSGVRVLGWLEWCLTDNYEWAAGYTPKFGLYSYDSTTFKRTQRATSASVYSQMAKANAIPGALADRYLSPSAG
jgi:beta-glucosidase/6-phospho-beta-glucosidase/beta-galactosidase